MGSLCLRGYSTLSSSSPYLLHRPRLALWNYQVGSQLIRTGDQSQVIGEVVALVPLLHGITPRFRKRFTGVIIQKS